MKENDKPQRPETAREKLSGRFKEEPWPIGEYSMILFENCVIHLIEDGAAPAAGRTRTCEAFQKFTSGFFCCFLYSTVSAVISQFDISRWRTKSIRALKGDASENVWLEMLQTYLASALSVMKGNVVYSNGAFSDQIDVLVFDRQYSPFIFQYQGRRRLFQQRAFTPISSPSRASAQGRSVTRRSCQPEYERESPDASRGRRTKSIRACTENYPRYGSEELRLRDENPIIGLF